MAVSLLPAACATSIESGPQLANPAAIAERLRSGQSADAPALLQFGWRYGDRRGSVEGDGVGRFNPPDSLRLDLFTSGDAAMAIASADGRLTWRGQIEDIDIPPRPFVFAMAGLFRPEPGAIPRAFVVGGDSVLVYGPFENRTHVFFLAHGRVNALEERRQDKVLRRVRVEWPASGKWPESAEYRDFEHSSRVRWEIEQVQSPVARHQSEIYALPYTP